jgi:predicted DNA-binding protein
MSHSEAKSTSTIELTIKLTPEMRERLDWLGAHYGKPIEELARDFFAEQLAARVEIARKSYGRRPLYRA